MVELILQHPVVKVDELFQEQTPLYIACSKRNAKIIKLLLEANADPNTLVEEPGRTGFLRAPPGRGQTGVHGLARWRSIRSTSWPYKTEELDPEATTECFNLMIKPGQCPSGRFPRKHRLALRHRYHGSAYPPGSRHQPKCSQR